MSTREEFENAPIGSIARRGETSWVLTRDLEEPRWKSLSGVGGDFWENSCTLADTGFTLFPAALSSAREALELAWELAYPVNSGDAIPKDMTCLHNNGECIETKALPTNWTPAFHERFRTLDPLPETEPDWLDALAVLAHAEDEEPHVWIAIRDEEWRDEHGNTRHWKDLKDVTQLYQLNKMMITQ